MSKPVPGSIAESEQRAQDALAEFERLISESIQQRNAADFPNQRNACRQRRLALVRVAEIRLLLE